MNCCKDCKWYERSEVSGTDGGWCHRYPPTILSEDNADSGYPGIGDFDYCGEFATREPEQGT